MSITDQQYETTLARIKKPGEGKIKTKAQALEAFERYREYMGLRHSHYHRYQTRGTGTVTGLKALGSANAYAVAANLWAEALKEWFKQ